MGKEIRRSEESLGDWSVCYYAVLLILHFFVLAVFRLFGTGAVVSSEAWVYLL